MLVGCRGRLRFLPPLQAHDVLSDPRKKAEYDSQLRLKAMLAAHEEAEGRGGFGSNPSSPM